MKYSFCNDYSCVGHPKVLEALITLSKEQFVGYGLDSHTQNAQDIIRKKINCPTAKVLFLAGGTQTNMVVISSILKPYQAVISVETGHINVHETGAIEGQGHKILTVPGVNGKITPEEIEQIVLNHTDIHMVEPKMVYISNATEIGTVYTKKELKDIQSICKQYKLYLFMDGARLASALTSNENDLTISDIATYCDVFYIGGTKNGALFGEALVIVNPQLHEGFEYCVKHYGALLAKGFVSAIMFEALMDNDLYLEIGRKENECAQLLQQKLKAMGIRFAYPSTTNQIFPILSYKTLEKLASLYGFEEFLGIDEEYAVIRLVCAFDTTIEICMSFIEDLHTLLN